MRGCDLHNGPRYLSNDADTEELFRCLDPIDPKIDIYVEHETPVQKQLFIRDFSVVNVANLVGCGIGVEDVNVDVDDDDDNDVDVDVEDGDDALVDDEFEVSGNLVDVGNDSKGHDTNGAMGDVTYEWYDFNYDNPANKKLYEITMNKYEGNTCQPTSPHNGQPSQEPTPNIAYHPLSYPPNFAKQ